MDKNLAGQLKKAIFNSLLGKYALYVVQILSLAILARIFTPEDFGVIAAAQVFLMFFQMLSVSGIAPAVVYQEHITDNMRDGVFSFSILLGFSLSILFLLLATPLFNWFEFERGQFVFYALSVSVLFSAISMMPIAVLQKDAKFIVIARAEILAELISFLFCILASLYVSGLIALTTKFIMVPVLRFIFYYIFSNGTKTGRPQIGKDIKQVVKLYDYAKYQMAFNILNFFSRNLDNILIAKFFGPALLGVYEKTYQLMRYPLQLFTFAITPALQPILTKYKDTPVVVYREFLVVANRLALVGLFSATVIYWRAPEIVFILFGDQWFKSVDFLRVLCLSIPMQMVSSSTGGIFQAFGATKAMFKCGVFSSFVTISAITTGVYFFDLLLICKLLVVAFFINYIQCFYMMHKTVFLGQKLSGSIFLLLITSLVFINLFFDPSKGVLPSDYFSSFLSIIFTSFVAVCPIVLFYFLMLKSNR